MAPTDHHRAHVLHLRGEGGLGLLVPDVGDDVVALALAVIAWVAVRIRPSAVSAASIRVSSLLGTANTAPHTVFPGSGRTEGSPPDPLVIVYSIFHSGRWAIKRNSAPGANPESRPGSMLAS